jgi:hypothetical protein
MKEELGYCGYNCHLCAARSEDPEIRKKMLEGWKRIFGNHRYNVDNVKCVGCINKGKHADINCKVRPCAIEKGVQNCALCLSFPCDKVRSLITSKREMMLSLFPLTSSISEEEYKLCMKQFESLPNLFKILIDVGKLPVWLKESAKCNE